MVVHFLPTAKWTWCLISKSEQNSRMFDKMQQDEWRQTTVQPASDSTASVSSKWSWLKFIKKQTKKPQHRLIKMWGIDSVARVCVCVFHLNRLCQGIQYQQKSSINLTDIYFVIRRIWECRMISSSPCCSARTSFQRMISLWCIAKAARQLGHIS